MMDRQIRTLKEQCVHRLRFETLQHSIRVISDWVGFLQYPEASPGAGMTPSEAFALRRRLQSMGH